MTDETRRKIEGLRKSRKTAHQFYTENSGVYRAFSAMEEAAFADGSLTGGEKELIAIGISVVINCESCMEWHISQALQKGISSAQILEAIEVGIEMGGGPATVSARFAMDVLEYNRS